MVATVTPPAWWLWLVGVMLAYTVAGCGLRVATIRLSVGLCFTLARVLLGGSKSHATFIPSAALLAVATILVLSPARSNSAKGAVSLRIQFG
ncbi:hypothetical protein [Ottowia thiooxydans]|uniref:Uncharacterized protein n=1 Tax=Ottowia thiooxydans TaxID=219182 RepID=A0ABV2QGU0_9BURK